MKQCLAKEHRIGSALNVKLVTTVRLPLKKLFARLIFSVLQDLQCKHHAQLVFFLPVDGVIVHLTPVNSLNLTKEMVT